MGFLAVLPSIYPLWTQRCLATMSPDFIDNTVIVDNTVTNRGVARSWNVGLDQAMVTDVTHLVVVSASMRFGPPGGDDFLTELDRRPDAVAIEAGHGIGWHLIAFPRFVLERIGRFDENFFAYLEDNDWGKRISLAFGLDPPYWEKVPDLDLAMAGFAHGIDLGGVRPDNLRQSTYYAAKWGANPGGGESFLTPFNDAVGLDFWPVPPDPRSIMEGTE